MTIFATVASGNRLLRVLEMPTEADLRLNIAAGETVIEGEYPPGQWYLVNGQPVPIPARPDGPQWQFDHDAGEWIDPRTPADLAAELTARRAAATMSKSGLLLALVDAGVLTMAEADAAVDGVAPARMGPVAPQARLVWRATDRFNRLDPVIQIAAHFLGLGDDQMDRIFNVRGDE